MGILQNIQYNWAKQIDPRVIDMPLVASSYQVPLIICAYLYFVLIYGPRFMKNRPPYSLKTFIQLYNIVQIVANTWLVYLIFDAGIFSSSIFCPIVLDYSYDYTSIRLARYSWGYFLLKILDYIETGIFVLRKKDNQVSTLHLYHHVSTLLIAWLGIRYFAVAPVVLVSMVNSFIHMLMYTYYFLAAYGPNVQKAIASMKQWITIAQMVQFVGLILYMLQNFWPDCKVVEHWIIGMFVGNVLINFYLFYNFYQKAYKKPKKKIR